MQSDPLGEVGRLYDWLGEPVTPEFEAGMRTWWADNAEHREPNVHPDPADFGLDLDEVRARFTPYTERMHDWIGEVAMAIDLTGGLDDVARARLGAPSPTTRTSASR